MEIQTKKGELLRQERQYQNAIKMILFNIVRQINPEWADKLEKADKILRYVVIALIIIGFIAILALH